MTNKETEPVRYPKSAELFVFCKEALSIKHNHEVKVIDQHVGAILGFDPADCSHWKRGKKNIKSLQTINAIAKHLQVDSRIVVDLISGRSDLGESLQEFKGYGPTELSVSAYEELKREYFRDPAKFSMAGKSRSFDELTTIDHSAIEQVALELLQKANVSSCPVMIPEILAVCEDISLRTVKVDAVGAAPVTLSGSPGEWVIEVAEDAVAKPHVRFMIAKCIGRTRLDPEVTLAEAKELAEARSNHFAGSLLMPSNLFALVMREIDDTRDIVAQLSETFWMTRSTVNMRLKSLVGALK
jgi:hypothetical protein